MPNSDPRSQLELRGAHILVVDDDAAVRTVVCHVLEQHGATVTAVGSAAQALELLGIVRPSAILTDITMPGHDGYWLLEQVRHRTPGVLIPIVAITGLPLDHPRRGALASGFDGYVAKPFNPAHLCRVMHSAIVAA